MIETLAIVGWLRYAVLVACLSGAAWFDYKSRRVANDYWISWSKPAIFLWFVELLVQGADWIILLSAIAMIAYASQSVIGRPAIKDLKQGKYADWIVSIFYLLGVLGIGYGAYTYGEILLIDIGIIDSNYLILSNESEVAKLWGTTIVVGLMIFIFDMAWRFRLIHGGADAKALMLIAILIPNWSTFSSIYGINFTPPALSLLLWGGVIFLLLPLILIFKNIKHGNIESINDLKMIWHAERMQLQNIENSHVWILDTIVENPDGVNSIKTSTRPPRKSRAKNDQQQLIKELEEMGREWAWVTHKYPLLTFLLPAVLPLAIFGDPVYWIMNLFGLI